MYTYVYESARTNTKEVLKDIAPAILHQPRPLSPEHEPTTARQGPDHEATAPGQDPHERPRPGQDPTTRPTATRPGPDHEATETPAGQTTRPTATPARTATSQRHRQDPSTRPTTTPARTRPRVRRATPDTDHDPGTQDQIHEAATTPARTTTTRPAGDPGPGPDPAPTTTPWPGTRHECQGDLPDPTTGQTETPGQDAVNTRPTTAHCQDPTTRGLRRPRARTSDHEAGRRTDSVWPHGANGDPGQTSTTRPTATFGRDPNHEVLTRTTAIIDHAATDPLQERPSRPTGPETAQAQSCP
ncbi:mucin-2-like [Pecten maximus]|uniref:mucin-2-like n=1 Tax=Pecten maximus TaxID=6579 RepID=UPI001458EE13|nr:mucin-2-like [Pecten maximus]